MIRTKESALAELRAAESWPFIDTDCGCHIKEDHYYGFGDSGSMWTSFDGCKTAEEAIAEIKKDWSDVDIGTNPEDLGYSAVTVLTGRQFVDRLYEIYDYNSVYLHEIYVDCWTV